MLVKLSHERGDGVRCKCLGEYFLLFLSTLSLWCVNSSKESEESVWTRRSLKREVAQMQFQFQMDFCRSFHLLPAWFNNLFVFNNLWSGWILINWVQGPLQLVAVPVASIWYQTAPQNSVFTFPFQSRAGHVCLVLWPVIGICFCFCYMINCKSVIFSWSAIFSVSAATLPGIPGGQVQDLPNINYSL